MEELINSVLGSSYLNDKIRDDNLSIEKEITLKSLVITYLIMIRKSEKIPELVEFLIPEIMSLKRTEYGLLFDKLIDYVYTENSDISALINNYVINGYYFHTTHEILGESILDGLPKPWNEQKLEEVQNIFKSKGKHDIFGLYNKTTSQSLFLAPSLQTSSYYGLTSPSWFTHFTSGGFKKTKEYEELGYYNRNYDVCLNNVMKACKKYNLTEDETTKTLDFFESCYGLFGGSSSLKVLLFSRKDVKDESNIVNKDQSEDELTYLKRIIRSHCSNNVIYKEKPNKEKILLIKYQTQERKMIL